MTAETSLKAHRSHPKFSGRRHSAADQAIGFLMQQAVENRDVVSLAAGLVDQASLPAAETRQALDAMLADEGRAKRALQYGTTAGYEALREQLVRHLARLEDRPAGELGLDADKIILTTGSQQLLALIADVLFDPGDICLVAAPTYFVFLGVLAGVGARAIAVETDDDGMNMDALDAQLRQLENDGDLDRVRMIYLVSYYENPSGISLSEQRRAEAVEIAKRWSKQHRIFVLEDAAYRELHYGGPKLPSVWSFDTDRDTVILAQTFSKSFSPGLRVGFGVVPDELFGPICDCKGNIDFGSANFNQHLLATVFEQHSYQPHVEQLCESYRAKRDCMLAAADRYFRDLPGVSWVHPAGGLYVWMTLPDHADTSFAGDFFKHATQVEKVMYVPGDLCYASEPTAPPRNHMRLSFGVQTPDGIDLGMQRLANTVRAVL